MKLRLKPTSVAPGAAMLEVQQQPEPQACMAEVAGHLGDVCFIERGDHLGIHDHEFINNEVWDQRADIVLLEEDRKPLLLIAELMRQRTYQISCGYEDADEARWSSI